MKNYIIPMMALAVLSGCANLQQLDSTLTQIKNVASQQQGSVGVGQSSTVPVGRLGDGTGYQPQFNITVPAKNCRKNVPLDQQAYIDGFKDKYVSVWDQFIVTHDSDPGSGLIHGLEKVHARAVFFKAYFIGMDEVSGIQHRTKYARDVTDSNLGQMCLTASYEQGEVDSWAVVNANEQQLLLAAPK